MEDFIKKPNNKNLLNQGGAWWKPAIEIFSQISTWIVVPIVLALIVGKKLDTHFDTRPWIFLGLAAIGFLISCFGIFKVITKYVQKIKELAEKK